MTQYLESNCSSDDGNPQSEELVVDNVAIAHPEAPGLAGYLCLLAKRKFYIAGMVAVAAAATAAYSLTLPKVYTATTKILAPQADNTLMASLLSQFGGLSGLSDFGGGAPAVKLYSEMLHTDTIKDAIINRFNLMPLYKVKYRGYAYKALESKVKVTAGKEGIITITVDDTDPKRSSDIANAYVDELGKLTISLNVNGAGQTRLFLEDRLAKAKTDLAKAEDALKAFQSRSKVVQVPDQARVTIEGVASLQAQLAAQEVQLAALQRQFTETSQEVKTQQATIAKIKSQIARLEGAGGGAIPSLGAVPSLGQEYVRLMREFKTREAVVELLTKQYEVARLSENNTVSTIKVLQKASVPEYRSKPARTRMVVSAAFVAAVFSSLAVIVLENLKKMPLEQKHRWNEVWRSFLSRG